MGKPTDHEAVRWESRSHHYIKVVWGRNREGIQGPRMEAEGTKKVRTAVDEKGSVPAGAEDNI